MGNPVASALAGAKSALASASKFTENVEGHKAPSTFAPHEYSHAPYRLAHAASQSGGTLGSELKAKSDNVNEYVKGVSDK